jgi:putative tricarboxylic transport membrane protein
MGRRDLAIGAALAALSALVFALTFGFPHLTIALSPTVFPRFVSGGLFVLSAILMAQGARRRVVGGAAVLEKAALPRPKWAFVLRFVLTVADALLYVAILEPAGYLLATPVFLSRVMLIFGERRWYRIALVSVVASAALYALFRTVFRVPLPRSLLW